MGALSSSGYSSIRNVEGEDGGDEEEDVAREGAHGAEALEFVHERQRARDRRRDEPRDDDQEHDAHLLRARVLEVHRVHHRHVPAREAMLSNNRNKREYCTSTLAHRMDGTGSGSASRRGLHCASLSDFLLFT